MYLKRFTARRLSLAFAALCPALLSAAQILNGPMPTHSTMEQVRVWVQTDEPAEVSLEYWLPEAPDASWTTEPMATDEAFANVALMIAREGIRPGTRYQYRVLVNGEPQEPEYRQGYVKTGPIPAFFKSKPRWRFIPPGDEQMDERGRPLRHSVPDFRIAMGSCAYINEEGYDRETGRPYGGQYQIFEAIYEQQPDLMLWLGDNVYYRENDFESKEGMLHRWTHDRQTPELRPLMMNAHHFATWDDHDYGPNNIGRNYWLKGIATEVFTKMWGNPSAGLPETDGIFTYLNWGDVNLYLLDNRTHAAPSESDPAAFGKPKPLLGKEQVNWLIDHLAWAQSQMLHDGKSYPARWNLIMLGNQVLNASGNADGYRNFPAEWQYLMDRLVAEKIEGVVFLSGDVHFGEMNRITHTWNGVEGTFYEVTSSPLTAGSWAGHAQNPARYDIFAGEMDRVGQRNFATLDFTGPLSDRRLEVRYYDSDGKLLNQLPGGAPGAVTPESILKAKDLKVQE